MVGLVPPSTGGGGGDQAIPMTLSRAHGILEHFHPRLVLSFARTGVCFMECLLTGHCAGGVLIFVSSFGRLGGQRDVGEETDDRTWSTQQNTQKG